MPDLRYVGLLLAASLSACAGPNLRGALAVDRGTEPGGGGADPDGGGADPGGQGSVSYDVGECRTLAGQPLPYPTLRVFRQRPSEKSELLVEYRARYSSVVIVNTYETAEERVFAYVSSDARSPDVLHEYHLPLSGAPGYLLVFDRFELEDAATGFRRSQGEPVLRCNLRRAANTKV